MLHSDSSVARFFQGWYITWILYTHYIIIFSHSSDHRIARDDISMLFVVLWCHLRAIFALTPKVEVSLYFLWWVLLVVNTRLTLEPWLWLCKHLLNMSLLMFDIVSVTWEMLNKHSREGMMPVSGHFHCLLWKQFFFILGFLKSLSCIIPSSAQKAF